MMEDLTNMTASHAPAVPVQESVPTHHRFHHTELWRIVHGEAVGGQPYDKCMNAEGKNHRTGPPVMGIPTPANGSARVDIVAILDAFLNELQSYCRDEKDLSERMRTLRFTRIGLIAGLLMHTPPEAGKNMDISTLVERALDIFDVELDIVRMELEHPELRKAAPAIVLVRWGGNVADLLEYHIGPQAAGLLQHPSGMPMTYEEAVEFIEDTYGITVSNASDRRAKILERVDNTSFTDKMRKVLLLEADKHNVKFPRK